jgi:hypothetical protein
MRRWIFTVIACLVVCVPTSTAGAQTDPKNKGLLISPLRSYSSFQAGTDVRRSFKVANLTDKAVDVNVDVEGFSVVDYAYDFKFGDAPNNWVRLVENHVTLQPYQSHDMVYEVNIPKNAPPGGHYYSFFASTNLAGAGVSSTVRAAYLLYLTVDGNLIRTSQVQTTSLPRLIITPQIPFSLDVKNTGNIHYFVYVSASIRGVFYHESPSGVSQLLMPGTTRHLESSINAPLLPSIYRVTYGYTPDSGPRVERSSWIIFLPPWFIILIILAGFTFVGFLRHRKKKASKTAG